MQALLNPARCSRPAPWKHAGSVCRIVRWGGVNLGEVEAKAVIVKKPPAPWASQRVSVHGLRAVGTVETAHWSEG